MVFIRFFIHDISLIQDLKKIILISSFQFITFDLAVKGCFNISNVKIYRCTMFKLRILYQSILKVDSQSSFLDRSNVETHDAERVLTKMQN